MKFLMGALLLLLVASCNGYGEKYTKNGHPLPAAVYKFEDGSVTCYRLGDHGLSCLEVRK